MKPCQGSIQFKIKALNKGPHTWSNAILHSPLKWWDEQTVPSASLQHHHLVLVIAFCTIQPRFFPILHFLQFWMETVVKQSGVSQDWVKAMLTIVTFSILICMLHTRCLKVEYSSHDHTSTLSINSKFSYMTVLEKNSLPNVTAKIVQRQEKPFFKLYCIAAEPYLDRKIHMEVWS